MQRPPDSALVLFPGALGDFICFLPTLVGLRQRHRGALLLVARPSLLALLRSPDVTTTSIDRREIADLFVPGTSVAAGTRELLSGFAQVYSWTGFGNAELAPRAARVTGGQIRVYPFRGMRAGEHAVDYYARCAGLVVRPLAAAAIRTDSAWTSERLPLSRELDGRDVLVVHPGSGSRRKNWQGFSAAIQSWQAHRGGLVVLLHGPAETEHDVGVDARTVRLHDLSLPQVAGLLRRSTLYLGNDSGVSHLAGALGARGVVIFGPTDPAAWAPRGRGLRVVSAPTPCARCRPDVFCIHRLPVQTVIDALEAARRA
ncbi:MAG: glycosyltransferase family 9 protein [Candidatus Binatia bacterium]